MPVQTLMLDEAGDLIGAAYPDGTETLVIATGAEQVTQAASQAVSLKQGRCWFNLSAGVDYLNLFYNATQSDSFMEPIRSAALRSAVLSVPGIKGFADTDVITYTRKGRELQSNIPCVLIDCENSIIRSFIGVLPS